MPDAQRSVGVGAGGWRSGKQSKGEKEKCVKSCELVKEEAANPERGSFKTRCSNLNSIPGFK